MSNNISFEPSQFRPSITEPRKSKVYALGYQGCDLEAVVTKMQELNAVLVDIRFMPFSRALPDWNKPALIERFNTPLPGSGKRQERYKHIPAFGNRNYNRIGGIDIADPESGLRDVTPLLEKQSIILLCTCADYRSCHRLVVANLLQEKLGVEVEHLPALKTPRKPATIQLQALSIRQPWAWLIAHGYKSVENREWTTSFRGRFFIHAGKQADEEWIEGNRHYQNPRRYLPKLPDGSTIPLPALASLSYGGIVGIATLTDCVLQRNSLNESDRAWASGSCNFVIRDAQPLPFTPLKGQLKFFDVPHEIIQKLLAELAGQEQGK